MATLTQPPGLSEEHVAVLALIEREGMPLTEAARMIPSRKKGKRVDVNTLWRWCKRGVAGGLRLRSVVVGGVRYTTKKWLAEFIEARSSASVVDGCSTSEPPRSPSARSSASTHAEEELRKRWRRQS